MFVFALIANATYVARLVLSTSTSRLFTCDLIIKYLFVCTENANECSILVRSTEWEKIKANMPWLLDAVVCVLLDLFVSFVVSTFSQMLNLVLNYLNYIFRFFKSAFNWLRVGFGRVLMGENSVWEEVFFGMAKITFPSHHVLSICFSLIFN